MEDPYGTLKKIKICWVLKVALSQMHSWLLSEVWNIIASYLSIFSTEKIPRIWITKCSKEGTWFHNFGFIGFTNQINFKYSTNQKRILRKNELRRVYQLKINSNWDEDRKNVERNSWNFGIRNWWNHILAHLPRNFG